MTLLPRCFKSFRKAAIRALAGAVLSSLCQLAAAETITVAVAANFAEPLRALASQFKTDDPHEIRIVTGSSGAHYSQILAGAPFDLFLSADSERPQQLAIQGRIAPGQVKTYAIGRLAVWMPGALSSTQIEGALKTWEGRLAISNPRLAPYGRAAIETLESMGLQSIANDSSRIVRGENVTQTYQFIATGNVGLGFVALSQVLNEPQGEYWVVPESYYQPIIQQLAVLRDSAGTRALLEFFSTPTAHEILLRFGYGLPSEIEVRKQEGIGTD